MTRRIIMSNVTLSTGVMIRDPATYNANVTVVNPTAMTGLTAGVEIFDLGVEQTWNNPVPVAVDPSAAMTFGAHTQWDFIALVNQSIAQPGLDMTLYEIRMTLTANSPLIVNCYGINFDDGIVASQTVLHAQLVKI